MQAREVLVSAHLDKAVHVLRGEADEVQVAFAATHGEVLELQVHIADTRVAIGHVGGQVAADALQALDFLLLLLGCDVLGLKVNQLYQGASNIHAEPWKG